MDLDNIPTWGADGIDDNSKKQMREACAIPPAVAGALMADAHLGYFLPIGGVLALQNAVCPYAVGVDIACRMKLTIFPIDSAELVSDKRGFVEALNKSTFFGVGVENNKGYDHDVLRKDWDSLEVIKTERDRLPIKERGEKQLGTSGSGNHFVEFGTVGTKVALLSHSGSRGTGAAVCKYYTDLAKALHPEYGEGAWLDMDTDEGRGYWDAMNLMGEYAAANHDCIHEQVAHQLGNIKPERVIENHHNFAWKETHNGRDVIVHRKGATPAGFGVLGIIPGSMGTPAYIVRGRGNTASLCSASHGAGRLMSRKLAKKTFDYKTEIDKLAQRGITVLSAGADEVCGVYKDIDKVMAAQLDLVDVMGTFLPRIVKMCGTNERAED